MSGTPTPQRGSPFSAAASAVSGIYFAAQCGPFSAAESATAPLARLVEDPHELHQLVESTPSEVEVHDAVSSADQERVHSVMSEDGSVIARRQRRA